MHEPQSTLTGRPRRVAAENALYKPCPACQKKYLVTEIELHVNMCLLKMEKQEAKLNQTSPTKPKVKKEPSKEEKLRKAQLEEIAAKLKTVPAAPIFYPTKEEFEDPLKYIESIKEKAQKTGICKIVPPTPPSEWLGDSFDQVIKPGEFYFQTKKQNVREITRRGISDTFYCKLAEFLNKNNRNLTSVPRICGKRIHLYQLFTIVSNLGGYNMVNDNNLWEQVAQEINVTPIPTNLNCLRTIYSENLLLYEKSTEKFEFTLANSPKKPTNSSNGMRAVQCPSGMRAVQRPDESTNNKGNKKKKHQKKNMSDDEDSSDSDDEGFGFDSGRVFNLTNFKKYAARFARTWLRENYGVTELPYESIEAEFWHIVENIEDDCIVHYGSDLDVSSHGSAFPESAKSGWNLNILPTLDESLLRYLPEHISGITIPMMYVGMIFSCFCWHTEDNYLYSINYLHTGAPKTWYGVSSDHCNDFERVMKESLPDLFEMQPDLLHQLITMLSPFELIENGVPVVRAMQHPGEFVVTFPQAYHGGYNNGFNVAEAVNFACPDWLPFGTLCVANYKPVKRTHVFSFQELMFNALQQERYPGTLRSLVEAFKRAVAEDNISRMTMIQQGITSIVDWKPDGPLPLSKPCKMCSTECYLSAVGCACSPNDFFCADHAFQFCKCSPSSKQLFIRYSLPSLLGVIEAAEKIVNFKNQNRKRLESPVHICKENIKRQCTSL